MALPFLDAVVRETLRLCVFERDLFPVQTSDIIRAVDIHLQHLCIESQFTSLVQVASMSDGFGTGLRRTQSFLFRPPYVAWTGP